jgi:hypothetical protein
MTCTHLDNRASMKTREYIKMCSLVSFCLHNPPVLFRTSRILKANKSTEYQPLIPTGIRCSFRAQTCKQEIRHLAGSWACLCWSSPHVASLQAGDQAFRLAERVRRRWAFVSSKPVSRRSGFSPARQTCSTVRNRNVANLQASK